MKYLLWDWFTFFVSDTDDRTTNDKTLAIRIFYLNYTEYAQKKFTWIYISIVQVKSFIILIKEDRKHGYNVGVF